MQPQTIPPRENAATPRFQVYICPGPSCGLRFTLQIDELSDRIGHPLACPACRTPLEIVGEPFWRLGVQPTVPGTEGPGLEVLLDNIRSAWNVGSMLRTCDGAGVRKVHLCGVSSAPDNPKVAKTSLGAEHSLAWSFSSNGVTAARNLKEQGLRLWALEGGPRAASLFEAAPDLPGSPILLIAGNELSGVDPGILDLCERVVCLPMQGVKGSLNVAVAFGIAVYFIRFGGKQ
jgi:23S rRNA (guanosine2251-2'-O)-methyltransferase